MIKKYKIRSKKKRKFLENYKLLNGNLSKIAKSVGISVRTYYNWKDKDPEFREQIEELEDSLIDDLEEELLTISKNQNNHVRDRINSILALLKAKAKNRGYSDNRRISSDSGKVQIIVHSNVPRPQIGHKPLIDAEFEEIESKHLIEHKG